MIKLLDCTLRDGGYYNNWDFDEKLVKVYLQVMASIKIDFVEIGFRSLNNENFKGAFAFSTDNYLNKINIPENLKKKIGVMINGSEISNPKTQISCLEKLFNHQSKSPVSLVRIACHINEFEACLPAANWLKKNGYLVGFNLMQISDCSYQEITTLAESASSYPVDVLYFADSLGNLGQESLTNIIEAFRNGWKGQLGIHTHDNMGQAIANVNKSIESGVTWVDSTVTGMGRGPGNAQTEYLILSHKDRYSSRQSLIELFKLIENYFKPMQIHYGWGMNPFYFLAGQNKIHPSYIQQMLQDKRYNEEYILTVIDHLKVEGGKKFNLNNLESARNFYTESPQGNWQPIKLLKDKPVLILGSGPGVKKYQNAIETYIESIKPYVIALNAQSIIKNELIDVHAACHPMRLLADSSELTKLPQPLITPFSMLPSDIKARLEGKEIMDFGIKINNQKFGYYKNYCEIPTLLVLAYAISVANSGKASEILLAGFDGYNYEDPRYAEVERILNIYKKNENSLKILSLTPTNYTVPINSIYNF